MPVNSRTGNFMQGYSWQGKSREFQEMQIETRHFQAFLSKVLWGMAIPGNSNKDNFSKAIIKKAIPGKAISGNYMQCNSRNGYVGQSKAKQFQPRQFQNIPGKAISGNSEKVIWYKEIPENSRQEILEMEFSSNSSQGNFSHFEARHFQARKLRAIPENIISG